MKQCRDASVEFLRCVMMCGIVIEHAISQCGFRSFGLGIDHILDSCVDGFVFISGYYGIKFRWGKVFRLLGVVLWVNIVLLGIRIFMSGEPLGLADVLKMLFDVRGRNWFLWAYIVVMFFAPLIEAAFSNDKVKPLTFAVPIFVVVFGWSYLAIFPRIGCYIPKPSGLENLSFLTLLGVYVFARTFRVLDLERFVGFYVLCIGVLVCCVIALAGEWHHNSIAMLFLGMSWFCLFKRLRVPKWVANLSCWCGPSMLFVLLLHTTTYGMASLRWLLTFMIERIHMNPLVSFLVAGTIVFAACVILDSVRRYGILLLTRQDSSNSNAVGDPPRVVKSF